MSTRPLPAELPGFDFPLALERLGHNQVLMRLLLSRFLHEYELTACRILTLIQAHQADKAAFLLHKIQGACLMIGANQLAVCAQQLEIEINSGGSLESTSLFKLNLNKVCATIKMTIE
jgi:HPt (histidine-containing phosphotransfer) domain-containing protein